MATSLTHKYIPRIEQTEENLFIEEYYSSTDTKIYMDDIEQTEIAYINYSLQEQLKPIYGYASRTFDDVAVGNRIVTGMFKVSIKNPEAQTSMDVIKERATNSTLEDYNENEQELMDAVDWITGNTTIYTDTVIEEDNETFEYKTKLIALGYNLSYNSSAYTLEQQIKKFQQDTGILEIDGRLTTSTKALIDEALENANLPKMKIPVGTKLYLSPIFSSSNTTIIEAQEVIILDTYDDGWTYIMTKDGEKGYINLQEGVV